MQRNRRAPMETWDQYLHMAHEGAVVAGDLALLFGGACHVAGALARVQAGGQRQVRYTSVLVRRVVPAPLLQVTPRPVHHRQAKGQQAGLSDLLHVGAGLLSITSNSLTRLAHDVAVEEGRAVGTAGQWPTAGVRTAFVAAAPPPAGAATDGAAIAPPTPPAGADTDVTKGAAIAASRGASRLPSRELGAACGAVRARAGRVGRGEGRVM
mmetsp:Transcript_3787/g.8550  ORF Transcript_3787/g.8550 Transcript_3787/m.8550 type:complete len:210 (+) Transcript_3787:139-768(+)